MKFNISYLFASFIIIFGIITFCNLYSLSSLEYDTLGAIINFTDIKSDLKIEQVVNLFANKIGLENEIAKLIFLALTPFSIPVIWTYAIGISPIVFIISLFTENIYFLQFSIFFLNTLILLTPVILLIKEKFEHLASLILSLTLCFLSPAIVYWFLSFSSYAFVVSGFCLLLLSEKYIEKKQDIPASAALGASVLLSYQFLPIAILLLLKNIIFTKSIKFMNYSVFPAFVIFASLSLLVLRCSFLGLHCDPASASAYDFQLEYVSFNILDLNLDFVGRFADRLLDTINFYIFDSTSYKVWMLVEKLGILFLFSIIFIYCTYYIHDNYLKVSFLILITQFGLYILGIQNFTASRHSLIMLLPLLFICLHACFNAKRTKHLFKSLTFQIIFVLALATLNYKNIFWKTAYPDTSLYQKTFNDLKADYILMDYCKVDLQLINFADNHSKYLTFCGSQKSLENINLKNDELIIYFDNNENKILEDIDKSDKFLFIEENIVYEEESSLKYWLIKKQ